MKKFRPVKIISIDDDQNIQELIKHYFKGEINTQIDYSYNYLDAISKIINKSYDLYIIDIDLDGYSGFEIMKILRKETAIDNRIIVISQSTDISDIIKSYDLGASNFINKPIDFHVMRAILNKNIRSISSNSQNEIMLNDILLNPLDRSCYKVIKEEDKKYEIHLSPTEFNILLRLMSSQGVIISKEELCELGRDRNQSISFKSLEMHISSLRRKIGKGIIMTKREVGYFFSK